jgi:VanZ family protein
MNYKYLSLTLALAGAIIWLSAVPSLRFVEADLLDQVIRKSGHVIVFGLLAFFLWRSLPGLDGRPLLKLFFCAVMLVGFAASDEIHQHFVPGRRGNLRGFAFDLAGIAAVLAFLSIRRQGALEAGMSGSC